MIDLVPLCLSFLFLSQQKTKRGLGVKVSGGLLPARQPGQRVPSHGGRKCQTSYDDCLPRDLKLWRHFVQAEIFARWKIPTGIPFAKLKRSHFPLDFSRKIHPTFYSAIFFSGRRRHLSSLACQASGAMPLDLFCQVENWPEVLQKEQRQYRGRHHGLGVQGRRNWDRSREQGGGPQSRESNSRPSGQDG